jgi:protein TonB
MDFASQQRNPAKHVVSIAAVILLHVFVVYALVSGLARKVVEVIRAPIETKVIEEQVKPPPPPEIPLPPPPKMEAPPPPFIPPPEVQIQAPPQPAPTISVQSHTPPPVADIRPVAPVSEAPPRPPGPIAIRLVCPTMVQPTMPRKALQEGISGSVTARATIRGGRVVNVEIVKANPRGVFESAVRSAMLQYQCSASGDQEVIAVQDFDFKLTD